MYGTYVLSTYLPTYVYRNHVRHGWSHRPSLRPLLRVEAEQKIAQRGPRLEPANADSRLLLGQRGQPAAGNQNAPEEHRLWMVIGAQNLLYTENKLLSMEKGCLSMTNF